MESDSPPPSHKVSPAHAPSPPSMTTHVHTDLTPTSSTSTPPTASPSSEESLNTFDFMPVNDSRDVSSDDSRAYGSPESLKPQLVTFQLSESIESDLPVGPLGGFQADFQPDDVIHVDLDTGVFVDGGFSIPPPPMPPPHPPPPPDEEIREAVVLEFKSSEDSVGPPPPIHGGGGGGGGVVPLELVVTRHEMSGKQQPLLAHASPPPSSLPSQLERETTLSGNFALGDSPPSPSSPSPSPPPPPPPPNRVEFVRRLSVVEGVVDSPRRKSVSIGKAFVLNEISADKPPQVTRSSSALAFREFSGGRPTLKRYTHLIDDGHDFEDDFIPPGQPLPPATIYAGEVTSPSQGNCEDSDHKGSEIIDASSPSVGLKRYRKKGLGLSLAINPIDLKDKSDFYPGQVKSESFHPPQNLLDGRPKRRASFVALSLEEGHESAPGDCWDHSELEEDALETMRIEKKEKWKARNIARYPKPQQAYSMDSQDLGDVVVTSVNITGEDGSQQKAQEKSSCANDSSSLDNSENRNNDGKKVSKIKSALRGVKEEDCEVKERQVKSPPLQKTKGTKDAGHENPAFLDDEQDAVSQEENSTADQGPQENSVAVPRPRSNPDIWVQETSQEDIARSRSYGNELNEVMNNLNAKQEEKAVAIPPTLRKRSTSRGRAENPEGKDNGILVENPTSTSKKEKVIVSFGPTFAYGEEDSATVSIFHKLVGTSSAKLTRSESAKSHLMHASKPTREEMFTRSISNLYDGGVRSKGSGSSSSYYGRPPQPPSSLPRDDHRRLHNKKYLVQQHLYRNSRRNMQQKLLRQLSDVYNEDRYSTYDNYILDRHNRDSSPSTPTDHRTHHGHGHHHHRSHSQKHRKPRHEPLRRLNTYGHEDYHKYVQGHEQRYQQARSLEQLQITQHGHGAGGQGGVVLNPADVGEAVRRISHYRQEEKGRTDVERWVGVHGDQPAEGAPSSQPLLPTPGTPHIVVSPEDSSAQNANDEPETPNLSGPGPNGPVFPNAQSTPAPPPTPANNTEVRRSSRSDKMNMTTLDIPDGRHPSLDGTFYKKTRRNSISEMQQRFGSQTNLHRSSSTSNIQRSNSRNSLAPSVLDWKQEGNDNLIACLSALYGKLLVVMGMAFPTAEVISHDIPVTFYNGFYLFLYFGSIIFLIYAYLFLLHSINIPTETLKSKFHSIRSIMTIPDISMVLPHRRTSKQEGSLAGKNSRNPENPDADKDSDRLSVNTGSFKTPKYTLTESTNHGSMYLKMGAVLFGIGSMIYSGLEVGQYFELKSDENCADVLLAISPAARMLFTFIQMYFIFLNSRVAISQHRVVARFGLMHMIGTNLCIWLNVLVQETKHEIINLTLGPGVHHEGDYDSHHGAGDHGGGHHGDEKAILGHHGDGDNDSHHALLNGTAHDHHMHDPHDIHKIENTSHHVVRRAASQQAFSIYECRRSDLMGRLVDEASPFLFPCTIEYSLLCAGVLYVIWKNINKPEPAYDGDSDISTYIARKARHHYSVDCAHANRGLFMGILILVLTIISLILFFVLINNEAYRDVAILEANIIELSVYGLASVTVVIGMIQMRELEFIPEGDIELDNILLLIAQSGVYIYTSFTIIGGHFTMTDNLILPLLSAIITLLQTTLQTIFILDASRRCCYNQDQLQRKPGREMVTFLLVCNLAMWAINTFETSRADAHPTQVKFYGVWAWTIISHISMPLAIFYRFHVTVCLCEIWKRSYKLRHDY